MVRILDFDGSVIKQKKLLSDYKPEIIDLRYIGPAARFYFNAKCREEVKERIGASNRGAVHFLGSGDFHHISEILINAIDGPIVLFDFDFHPDWSIIAPRYSCGSWFREVLKNENVSKCLLAGVPHLGPISRFAHFALFRKVYCSDEGKGLGKTILKMANDLSIRKAYITIDKDCLDKRYALTNWHEGKFTLEQLTSALKTIKENFEIIGADITGEYSEIEVKGAVKKVISYFNHPRNFSARDTLRSRIDAINEAANLTILEALLA